MGGGGARWMVPFTSLQSHPHACTLNPFIAPACTISGLKDAWMHLKNTIFSSPVTSPFSVMYFDENPLQGQCEKEKKKA